MPSEGLSRGSCSPSPYDHLSNSLSFTSANNCLHKISHPVCSKRETTTALLAFRPFRQPMTRNQPQKPREIPRIPSSCLDTFGESSPQPGKDDYSIVFVASQADPCSRSSFLAPILAPTQPLVVLRARTRSPFGPQGISKSDAAILSNTLREVPQSRAPAPLHVQTTKNHEHTHDKIQDTANLQDGPHSDYESLMIATEINLTPYMQERFILSVSNVPVPQVKVIADLSILILNRS